MNAESSLFERILNFIDKDGIVKGWNKLPFSVKVKNKVTNLIYLTISIFYLIILFYATFFLLPTITTPDTLLIVIIALIALILQFATTLSGFTKPESRDEITYMTIEWNYNKLKNEPLVKDHLPLLRGLITLKVKDTNFKLSELYKKYPSIINEENAIGNFYGLSSSNSR